MILYVSHLSHHFGDLGIDRDAAEVKMHKVPVQEDGIWTQQPRYTFEGMDFEVTN